MNITSIIRLLVIIGLCGNSLAVQAQTNAPSSRNVHPIRSISPTDTSFADLEFLVKEIGGARVVMLGEPTHGEGNVFEAKVRLMRFLQQRMGFTTVAFESGFYELDRAQREIEMGQPVREAIERSVFGVWTGTQEFQAVLPLLGRGKLKVAGFDYQLSGDYQTDLLEELETFLKPEKGAGSIAYDYLDECFSTMGELFTFPPMHNLTVFNLQLGKVRKMLQKAAASPNPQRRARAAFWLQTLQSLGALAHDYATNDPGVKGATEFKAADSNPRDAQMADNLLWYVRQHPKEKVICWGALPHLANKAEVLEDAEIKSFRPMGQAVKAALGDDAVYVLGTLAGGGTHGFGNMAYEPVPAPAPGTLEAELLATGQEYCFVSLKHDAPDAKLTTYAFEYKPLTGAWRKVVDGFLFLKSVNPPHGAVAAVETRPVAPTDSVATTTPMPRRDAAMRRVLSGSTTTGRTVRGVVLDHQTGAPVPFASVAIPSRAVGTVADAQGRFVLPAASVETMQITSVGYETLTVRASSATLTARLKPAAYALGNVQVKGESLDPRRIMKKVLAAIPTNHEQNDYAAQVYTHRRLSNFDTLRHEVEFISQLFEPTDYHYQDGGFLMMGPRAKHRVQEKHEIVGSPKTANASAIPIGSRTAADPIRTSPLFKSATLGKYVLRLDTVEQQGQETVYVIGFAVKRATHRSTGAYLEAGYSGKVYVRQQDYAVIRYEALWQFDTVRYNAVTRKYYGRKNDIARLYTEVFSDNRAVNTVTYSKGVNGRYHAAISLAQHIAVGRKLGSRPFHYQSASETYFTSLPAGTLLLPLDPTLDPQFGEFEMVQLQHAPYRPEFWQTYQRPTPTEPMPVLRATKP